LAKKKLRIGNLYLLEKSLHLPEKSWKI